MSILETTHGNGCPCTLPDCSPTPADNEDAYPPTTPYQAHEKPPAPLTPTVDISELVAPTLARLDASLTGMRRVLRVLATGME